MAEAEVTLRLAFWLLKLPEVSSQISVAIDGAQVAVAGRTIFQLPQFMEAAGWIQARPDSLKWTGKWMPKAQDGKTLYIHSRSGQCDLVAVQGQHRILVESKGGPLVPVTPRTERTRLQAAIGQIVTTKHRNEGDICVAAVPWSAEFERLAVEFRSAPLFSRTGVQIALIHRSGDVSGLAL